MHEPCGFSGLNPIASAYQRAGFYNKRRIPLRPTIESLQNPRVKQALRLREAAQRRKLGRFLIDGRREIELAAAAGIELDTVFVSPDESWQCPAGLGPEIRQPVASKVLERISYGERQAEPVAVAVTPDFPLSRITWRPPQMLLVLDRTEKPGNLGACLRTAAAAGVGAVVLTDPVCEPWNPNAIRASRGNLFTLPLAVSTRQDFMEFCRQQHLPCWLARVDASSHSLWEQDFTGGGAIVFGNEAEGLGPAWQGPELQSFSIPMRGAPDSLNLSISAAVTLYEALRQRRSV